MVCPDDVSFTVNAMRTLHVCHAGKCPAGIPMSKNVFWKSTLRKLHALFLCHREYVENPSGKK